MPNKTRNRIKALQEQLAHHIGNEKPLSHTTALMFSDVLNQISKDLDVLHPPDPESGPIEYERTEPNPWRDANEIRPQNIGDYEVMLADETTGSAYFDGKCWYTNCGDTTTHPVIKWRSL